MINNVTIAGRMTRDPELRRTGNGNAAAHFTLALNRSYNSADGQQADFIRVVCWNKTAENVAQYCGKGSLIGVEGRLRSGSYTNSQGVSIPTVEVIAIRVAFLESKKEAEKKRSETGKTSSGRQSTSGDFYDRAYEDAAFDDIGF